VFFLCLFVADFFLVGDRLEGLAVDFLIDPAQKSDFRRAERLDPGARQIKSFFD
jgi:hypothetical protein